LGLYISERIVRAHGGMIRVESSEKEGTLFETVIPCEPAGPRALRVLSDEPASDSASPAVD
jgi:signal transduction histidine kinase